MHIKIRGESSVFVSRDEERALEYVCTNGLIIVLKKIKSRWDHKTPTNSRERKSKRVRRRRRKKEILIRDNYSQPMTR